MERVATRNGRVVEWQNFVGAYGGQSGKWEFQTEKAAISFAKYAILQKGNGLPTSLHKDIVTNVFGPYKILEN